MNMVYIVSSSNLAICSRGHLLSVSAHQYSNGSQIIKLGQELGHYFSVSGQEHVIWLFKALADPGGGSGGSGPPFQT